MSSRNTIAVIGGTVAALVLILGAISASFMLGRETRDSDKVVEARVVAAVDHRGEQAEAEVEEALAEQRQDFRERLKKVRKRARSAGYKVGKKSGYQEGNNDGYAAGNSAGYSAGNSAGYSSGHSEGVEEGVEEGIEKGSDELSCSDDLDVPLPPCDYDY